MRAFETEKTDVAEVDRSIYDIKDAANAAFEVNSGLTPDIVAKISEEKHDPEWMRGFRQKSLEIYNKMPVQNWGPSIEGLDMNNIVTYVRPNTEMRGKWDDVPEDIKNTFERLGIPKAERASLAGVGAQYDSEVVYHNVKSEVAEQGVQVSVVFPGFVKTNVSFNALNGEGKPQGHQDEAIENGLDADIFAKTTVKALMAGDEYIVVGGTKEKLGVLVSRLSPSALYKMIRKTKVK